ncbi:MAG: YihY/virulence factor BrkB family protein [Marinoscillum sp.]
MLRNSVGKYSQDDPIRLSGTTAFFLILAMAPILILSINIAGMLISESTVQEKLLSESESFMGPQGMDYLKSILSNSEEAGKTSWQKKVIGALIFLGISTTFFNVVQNSLNYIWRVRPKPEHNFLKLLRDRGLSFIIMIGIGMVMLLTLFLDAAIGLLGDYINELLPDMGIWLIKLLNVLLSFVVVTFIFSMIYRFLPDVIIKWKETWVGGLITGLLFILGKYLIGFLLGQSGIADMYGTAGSIVIVLMWLFYSSVIFYFGAEITYQFAIMYGRSIQPKKNAVKIEINELTKDG